MGEGFRLLFRWAVATTAAVGYLGSAAAEPVMIIISRRRGSCGGGERGDSEERKTFFFGNRLREKIFSRLHVVAAAIILVTQVGN